MEGRREGGERKDVGWVDGNLDEITKERIGKREREEGGRKEEGRSVWMDRRGREDLSEEGEGL